MSFTKAYHNFFKLLASNNNREWFQTNKTIYEKDVKKPFESFISELLDYAHALNPMIISDTKKSILRINRDIRFAADKSPYNLSMRAIISEQGAKDKEYPGVYISMGVDGIAFYGGWHGIAKDNLLNLRTRIAADPTEIQKIIKDKDFIKHFESLQGESNKVIPKEFKEIAINHPIIAMKQFYVVRNFDAKKIVATELVEEIKGLYLASQPLINYLKGSAG